MKRFSDFASAEVALDGDKVKIDSILGMPIIVTGYRIRQSRYSKNQTGEYLTLQFEMENKKWILFTGSDVLIEQVRKYSHEMPFEASIKKISRYYAFT